MLAVLSTTFRHYVGSTKQNVNYSEMRKFLKSATEGEERIKFAVYFRLLVKKYTTNMRGYFKQH